MAESLEDRSLLFTTMRDKFPDLKNLVIKNAIVKFNYDSDKIVQYLSHQSQIDSDPNGSLVEGNKSRASSSSVYSFRSAISEDNVYCDRSFQYLCSADMSKITIQKDELKKIEDAFRKLEKDKNFLLCQNHTLYSIKETNYLRPSFPNESDLEDLEIQMNRRACIGTKSFSYANDLRQPSDMMHRFKGFQQPFNPHNMLQSQQQQYEFNNRMTNSDIANPDANVHFQVGSGVDLDHLPSSNYNQNSINPTRTVLYPSKLNPNVYYSPTSIQAHLNPFMPKRNSSHFPQGHAGMEMYLDRNYSPNLPPPRPNSYQHQSSSSHQPPLGNNNAHSNAGNYKLSHKRNSSYEGVLTQETPQLSENTYIYKKCPVCKNTSTFKSNHQLSNELNCQFCSYILH